MPIAEVDGLRLYYERSGGGGPELLVLPGWCCAGSAVRLPIATAVIRNLTAWDGVGALGLCVVPILLLLAKIDAETEALRLLAIKSDITVGITVGAGHFHQLEVPDQVNAMIDRFLE